MKGLFLKDWYMILRYGKWYLLYFLLYGIGAAFPGSAQVVFIMINAILGSMIVKTLMAYEEQSRWDSLAVNLPVTAKQLVTEKYLVGFCGALFANVFTFLIMWVVKLVAHVNTDMHLAPLFILYTACGMLYLALQLPILFKYGTANSRLVYMIVVGAIAGVSAALGMSFMRKEPEVSSLPGLTPALLAAVLVIAAAGTAFSMKLSVSFYQKREF